MRRSLNESRVAGGWKVRARLMAGPDAKVLAHAAEARS